MFRPATLPACVAAKAKPHSQQCSGSVRSDCVHESTGMLWAGNGDHDHQYQCFVRQRCQPAWRPRRNRIRSNVRARSDRTACTKSQGCFGPGTVIMTINTNVSSGNVASLRGGQGETAFAAMFGLGLLGFAFGKRKSLRGRYPTLVCLLLCCGIMAAISGCGTKQLGTTSGTTTTPEIGRA